MMSCVYALCFGQGADSLHTCRFTPNTTLYLLLSLLNTLTTTKLHALAIGEKGRGGAMYLARLRELTLKAKILLVNLFRNIEQMFTCLKAKKTKLSL
jgi:hypothetical protein